MEISSEQSSAKERSQSTWSKDLKLCIILILVMLILFRGIFVIARVPTGSMIPTIREHSAVIAWRLSYLLADPMPKHGDIIVFDHEEFDEHLVKRVIGLPGDEIIITEGQVFINGEELTELYLAELDAGRYSGQFIVPEGKLFVLGDNRNHSNDSRYWNNPYVDIHKVYAKALLILNNPFR